MKKNAVRTSFTFLFTILILSSALSQTIPFGDRKKLREKEDSLKMFAKDLVLDSTTSDRMVADSVFTRVFVRALQIKNSFYYPFDSIKGISKLYAPDTSFRIFTWNLQIDDFWSLQRGAIQLKTSDGTLKLIGLHDVSTFNQNIEDSVRGKNNWIGAIYYNIIKTEYKGKNYYTLFGLDPNNAESDKKWIEVMTFNEKKEPVFGGPYFSFDKDSIPKSPRYRYSMEYKKDTRVLANYIPDLNMILVDELVSESDEPENKWTFVPDGDNEGFKWENGKWVHVENVFNYKIDMKGVDPLIGKPPVGDPLYDSKGNKDEKKLQEKTDKNKTKTKDNNDY